MPPPFLLSSFPVPSHHYPTIRHGRHSRKAIGPLPGPFLGVLLPRAIPMTEADTCRKFVVPLLQKAGWDNEPHSIAEQRWFTPGPHRRSRQPGQAPPRQTRRLSPPLHAGLPHRRRRGQGRLQEGGRWPPAGKGVRWNPRPAICLRHQRPGDHRIRLHHRPGAGNVSLPDARRTLVAPARRGEAHRRRPRPMPAHTLQSDQRQDSALLPADRHPPRGAGHPPGQTPRSGHHGHRHRQDRGRVSHLLDALVLALESHRLPRPSDGRGQG